MLPGVAAGEPKFKDSSSMVNRWKESHNLNCRKGGGRSPSQLNPL